MGDSSQLLSLVAVFFNDAAKLAEARGVSFEDWERSIIERIGSLGDLKSLGDSFYLGTFWLNWRGVAATAEVEQPTHD